LAGLDDADELGGGHERVEGAGVEPGGAAVQRLGGEGAQLSAIEGGARPYEIRERQRAVLPSRRPVAIGELTRLASAIETWWPAVEAFLRLGVTNARTEGYSTNIKLIKRTAPLSHPGQLSAPYIVSCR